jgi:hypothetical protein
VATSSFQVITKALARCVYVYLSILANQGKENCYAMKSDSFTIAYLYNETNDALCYCLII